MWVRIVFLTVLSKYVLSQNASPCPETFSYEPRGTETDRWYGVVSLTTRDDLKGIFLRIILDRPAELLGNWFGETTSDDNKEYLVKNLSYKLEAGPPVSIRFFVRYNAQSAIPSVREIRLNGRLICSEETVAGEGTTQKLHISRPNTGDNTNNVSQRPTSRPTTNNGRPSINGRPTTSNNRPSTNTRPPVTGGSTGAGDDTSYYGNVARPATTNNRPSSNNGHVNTRPTSVGEDTNTNNRPSSNNRPVSGRPTSVGEDTSFYGNDGRPTISNNRPSSNNRPATGRPSGVGGDGTSSFGNDRENTNNHGSSNNNNNYNDRNPSTSNNQMAQNNYNYENNFGGDTLDNRFSSNSPSSTGLSAGSSGETGNDFFAGDFAVTVQRPSASTLQNNNQKGWSCGTTAMRPSPLITNGQNTTPGQWPWHAALYYTKGDELKYTCGGTLISEDHILTAAHCVTRPQTNRPISAENVLVYLGKYHLKKFGSEVQSRDVSDVYVHPEYNSTVYFNDIAILKLSQAADVTNYVRPCCLWEESDNLETVLNKHGTVIGWGFDENRLLSANLMQAEMPVVSTVTCIYSNRDFFSRFTSEKSYCAGFRNGTTVCNGDSGGGMVFPKRGTSGHGTVWQIRGLVSVGVALQGQGVCDPAHYIVFTDVAKHSDWIKRTLNR